MVKKHQNNAAMHHSKIANCHHKTKIVVFVYIQWAATVTCCMYHRLCYPKQHAWNSSLFLKLKGILQINEPLYILQVSPVFYFHVI